MNLVWKTNYGRPLPITVRGDVSTVSNYEDVDIDGEEDFMYFEIGDVLDEKSYDQLSITNVTLPQHRRCACHFLSLIAKVAIIKIHDFYYQ
ncbi:hypothetical protein OUZ56_012285 [Daphnia magna]|uniref:Uncharacterized protein n=1 Tax=Daphnia magna TaxID=35525 RepID=A0ABQ9Z2J5_9CRUS|nr:hypothetical protein OUZ56_012285 [Daphnia magna]